MQLAHQAAVSIGSMELRPSTREATWPGGREVLQPRVMQVLVALTAASGRVVSRDDLIADCWDGRIVSDDAINFVISQVRKLAGRTGAFEVETIPRVGYRLVACGLKELGAEIPLAPPARSGRRDSLLGPEKPSIAVLPFSDMTGSDGEDYLTAGMVEEIATALSRFQSLFVIAGSSTLGYRPDTRDLPQIARELGVRYLLEGAVRRAGDRVRISVNLTDAVAGLLVWTERFDGVLEDVFDLQDTVANAAAGQIEPTIVAAETRRTEGRPSQDLGAYELFLRASFLRREFRRKSIVEAIGLLDEAIARAPRYAKALALAASLRAVLSYTGGSRDLNEMQDVGLQFCRRAMRAGGDDPQVLAWVADALSYLEPDIAIADAIVERALALNRGSANSWYVSGWIKVFAGKPELALEHLGAALRLDPRSPDRLATFRGISLSMVELGRYEEALDVLSHGNVAALVDFWVPVCLAHLGRLPEARDTFRQVQPGTLRMIEAFRNPAHREIFRSGLALAGAESTSQGSAQEEKSLSKASRPGAT